MRLSREPSASQVIKELEKHIHRRRWVEIVFCGFGEPTIRLDCLLQVTRWINENSDLRIRINTNVHAYLLNLGREVVEELKETGVDDVSVSLNGHDEETYNRVCRPVFADAYESVLEFIRRAKRLLSVEITTVRVPEIDVPKIERLASQFEVKLRLREYVPCFY